MIDESAEHSEEQTAAREGGAAPTFADAASRGDAGGGAGGDGPDAPLNSDAGPMPTSPLTDVLAAAMGSSIDADLRPEKAENSSVADGFEAPSGSADTQASLPLVPVVEAILFSSEMPLTAGKIAETVGLDSTKPVKAAIETLNAAYAQRQAAYRVEERAGGYQLLTLPEYAQYVQRLARKKDEGRLTPAALETLAVVAYKQPILRVDVEAIRGVSCGEMIRSLMEHNLVKIVGRAQEVGRPMLYGTTRYFLEVFGLANLRDLPQAGQLQRQDTAAPPAVIE